MFKHYFETIENVEIFPIISLSIFFLFFLGLIWWVIRADKNYINKMKSLPMEEDNVTYKNDSQDEKNH
jgi:cbb3-type cytochrome oxidase subunit 3